MGYSAPDLTIYRLLPDKEPRSVHSKRLDSVNIRPPEDTRIAMTEGISTQAYIDRSMDAVRAQNDVRFAELLAEMRASNAETKAAISTLSGKVEGLSTAIGDTKTAVRGARNASIASLINAWVVGLAIIGAAVAAVSVGWSGFSTGLSSADTRFEQLETDRRQDEQIEALAPTTPPAASAPEQ